MPPKAPKATEDLKASTPLRPPLPQHFYSLYIHIHRKML